MLRVPPRRDTIARGRLGTQDHVMEKFFESSSNVSGLIMAVIFVIAGVKLWQQSREEKEKKK